MTTSGIFHPPAFMIWKVDVALAAYAQGAAPLQANQMQNFSQLPPIVCVVLKRLDALL
jgi:hypothetical protein